MVLNRFLSFFRRGNNKPHNEIDNIGWVRSLTVGIQSKATALVNNTKYYDLWMRDKVGSVYGKVRYKIPPKSQLFVTTQQHTYFQMLVYAIPHQRHEVHIDTTSTNKDHHQQDTQISIPKQHVMSFKTNVDELVDTTLTLDSDDLANSKKIEISYDEQKHIFKISDVSLRRY